MSPLASVASNPVPAALPVGADTTLALVDEGAEAAESAEFVTGLGQALTEDGPALETFLVEHAPALRVALATPEGRAVLAGLVVGAAGGTALGKDPRVQLAVQELVVLAHQDLPPQQLARAVLDVFRSVGAVPDASAQDPGAKEAARQAALPLEQRLVQARQRLDEARNLYKSLDHEDSDLRQEIVALQATVASLEARVASQQARPRQPHQITGANAGTPSAASQGATAADVQRVAGQRSREVAAAMTPGLQNLTKSWQTAGAELAQLQKTVGARPDLAQRLQAAQAKLQHLEERMNRYIDLAGGQAAIRQLGVQLTDRDGTTLDASTIDAKVNEVGAQVTSAAQEAQQALGFVYGGLRGQQNQYASQVHDQQLKAAQGTIAQMDDAIAQARGALGASAGSPAQRRALGAMEQARQHYVDHAAQWLTREYGRSLVNAGDTAPLREADGRPVDRRTLNAQAARGLAALTGDVSAFSKAAAQFRDAPVTPGAPVVPVVPGTTKPPRGSGQTPPTGGTDPTPPRGTPPSSSDAVPVTPPRTDPSQPPADQCVVPPEPHGDDAHGPRKTPEERRTEERLTALLAGGSIGIAGLTVAASRFALENLTFGDVLDENGQLRAKPEDGNPVARDITGGIEVVPFYVESQDGLAMVTGDLGDLLKGRGSFGTDLFVNFSGFNHDSTVQMLKDLGVPKDQYPQLAGFTYLNVSTEVTIDPRTRTTNAEINIGTLTPRASLPEVQLPSGRNGESDLFSSQYLTATLSGGDAKEVMRAQEEIVIHLQPLQARAKQQLENARLQMLDGFKHLRDAPPADPSMLAQQQDALTRNFFQQQKAIGDDLRTAEKLAMQSVVDGHHLTCKFESSDGLALLAQNPSNMVLDPATGKYRHANGSQVGKDGALSPPDTCFPPGKEGGNPRNWQFVFASLQYTTPSGLGNVARGAIGNLPTDATDKVFNHGVNGALLAIDGIYMTQSFFQAVGQGRRLLTDGNTLYMETAKDSGKFRMLQPTASRQYSLEELEHQGAEPVLLEMGLEGFTFNRSGKAVSPQRQNLQLYTGSGLGVTSLVDITADGTTNSSVTTPIGKFNLPLKGFDALPADIRNAIGKRLQQRTPSSPTTVRPATPKAPKVPVTPREPVGGGATPQRRGAAVLTR